MNGAEAQLEESLNRLKTEHIDLYQRRNASSDDALDRVLGPGGAYEAAV
jgi:aryl-alcohol dehydrogenase-like predicted oxidoreductase